MAKKMAIISFISAAIFSFFMFINVFEMNAKLQGTQNDPYNYNNEVFANPYSTLILGLLACISLLLFICFGTVWITGRICKRSDPYMIFAVTSGVICLGTLIAALVASADDLKNNTLMTVLSRASFLSGWLITVLPFTLIILIADLILWHRYKKGCRRNNKTSGRE